MVIMRLSMQKNMLSHTIQTMTDGIQIVTNFVSQCLYYGGESMRKNSNVAKKKGGNIYSSKTHWFYCGDAQKYAVSTPWLRCSGTNNF